MTSDTLHRDAASSGSHHARPAPSALRLLVGREASAFWRTRTWWIQLAAYLLLVAGLGGVAMLELSRSGALDAAGPGGREEAKLMFFVFHLIFVSAGTVVTAQGAILGEKQRGSAAWILSKPVARRDFVLAKALALGGNAAAVGVLAPVAAALPVWVAFGFAPTPLGLLAVVAGLTLNVLFYLSLTLALGTLFESRAAIAGGALVTLFAMIQFGQSAPAVVPGALPFALAPALGGGPLPSAAPFALTAAASAALLALAVWRFGRSEL